MAVGIKWHPEVAMVAKDLVLHACNLGKYLTEEFALWLDLRSSDDDGLPGNGRRIKNASKRITIEFAKEAEDRGALNINLFVLMDALLNI